MKRFTVAAAVALLSVGAPLQAQEPRMPDDARLHEPYLAWDRGDYPDAVRGYLALLRGADGLALSDQIALLTGERYKVTEVTKDGTVVAVSPDGLLGSYQQPAGADGVVTRIVDMATGASQRAFLGSVALGPNGAVAHLDVDLSPEVVAARRLQDEAQSQGRGARSQAAAATAWKEAKAARVVLWSGEESREVDMGGLAPISLTFAAGTGDLFALAAPLQDRQRANVYRLGATGPERLGFEDGVQGSPIVSADGQTIVITQSDAVVVRRDNGELVRFPGATNPSLSNRGATLAFLRRSGPTASIEVVDLAAEGAQPRVIFQSEKQIATPVVSPSGAQVAFSFMDLHDWEIFVAASDGNGEQRLTLEIQHDRNPRWVDDTHVLAAKGEGRHMRSYLYDTEGRDPVKLFHNNSIRTIAPEYAWASAPGTGKILLLAERDGDTVSPERGVYLLDLNEKVTRDGVIERLETALANEEDLRSRGQALFAPIAADVATVTHGVSEGRIFQYARDVYGFGSKHVTQPGNALAIQYYADKLRSFGYEPELQWFEGRGQRTANVIVRILGTANPELVYVASSHFDSTERGPGADDDSSGATALLEAARVMKGHPREATIEFAFFTGEEAGLLGSREYVRHAVASGKRIVGALNNDMIGWKNDHRLDNTIRYSNPGIRDIQHAAAMQFSELITYDALYYKSTDAAAYYEAYGDIVGGIGSYPVLGNPHYHQWTDRLETIDQQLVAEVSKTTVATLMLLASSPSRITGLEVEKGTASWSPSPESRIEAYEVQWEIASGWAAVRVTESSQRLEGLIPEGAVQVRALGDNGTLGWDWARTRGGR
ncbi:MAG: M20/M25/M40 family metallo-hydrolase [Gemmatimonadetes bacterium]|nr:M20/M25/M40 family metallo-hydrolase [Gemmatimonadota bacterium]